MIRSFHISYVKNDYDVIMLKYAIAVKLNIKYTHLNLESMKKELLYKAKLLLEEGVKNL